MLNLLNLLTVHAIKGFQVDGFCAFGLGFFFVFLLKKPSATMQV